MKKVVICLLGILSLSACNSEQPSGVNSDGTCNQDYINSYNQLAGASRDFLQWYSANPSATGIEEGKEKLRAIDQECDSFTAKFGTSNCNAQQMESGTAITTDSTKIKSMCSSIKDELNRLNSSTATVESNSVEEMILDLPELNAIN